MNDSLLFGPAGWHYEDWKGRVYPERPGARFHPLPYLARYLDFVEVNATFYAPQRASVAQSWVDRVAEFPRFRFAIKLWGRCTHERELPSPAEIDEWKEVLAPLREAGRLVAVLVQFPFSFQPSGRSRERLLRIREHFPNDPLAVEFRRESWRQPRVLQFLRDHEMAFVNIDQPRSEEGLAPSDELTAPLGYIRLHGRNADAWFDPKAGRDERYDYRYTRHELEPWVAKIRSLKERCQRLIVVGNNHYRGKSLAAVFELLHLLTGEKRPLPEPMIRANPGLEDIAAPESGYLF